MTLACTDSFKNPWNWTILQRHSIKTCDTAEQSEAIGTTVSRHISSRFFNESLRCNYDRIVVSCSHSFVRTSCSAYRQPLSRTSLLTMLFEAIDMRCFHTPRFISVDEWLSRDFCAVSKMMCFLFYLMTTISFFSFSEFQAVLSVECQYLACFAIFGAFSCVLHFKLSSREPPQGTNF